MLLDIKCYLKILNIQFKQSNYNTVLSSTDDMAWVNIGSHP